MAQAAQPRAATLSWIDGRHANAKIALLGVLGTSQAFYLPGVAPVEYTDGARVDLKVNKLTSVKTQLPYDYYSMPFCKPPAGVVPVVENLGEILAGDLIENSAYDLRMNDDQQCKLLCKQELTKADRDQFRARIDDEYMVNMIVDNLPAPRSNATGHIKVSDGDGTAASEMVAALPGQLFDKEDPIDRGRVSRSQDNTGACPACGTRYGETQTQEVGDEEAAQEAKTDFRQAGGSRTTSKKEKDDKPQPKVEAAVLRRNLIAKRSSRGPTTKLELQEILMQMIAICSDRWDCNTRHFFRHAHFLWFRYLESLESLEPFHPPPRQKKSERDEKAEKLYRRDLWKEDVLGGPGKKRLLMAMLDRCDEVPQALADADPDQLVAASTESNAETSAKRPPAGRTAPVPDMEEDPEEDPEEEDPVKLPSLPDTQLLLTILWMAFSSSCKDIVLGDLVQAALGGFLKKHVDRLRAADAGRHPHTVWIPLTPKTLYYSIRMNLQELTNLQYPHICNHPVQYLHRFASLVEKDRMHVLQVAEHCTTGILENTFDSMMRELQLMQETNVACLQEAEFIPFIVYMDGPNWCPAARAMLCVLTAARIIRLIKNYDPGVPTTQVRPKKRTSTKKAAKRKPRAVPKAKKSNLKSKAKKKLEKMRKFKLAMSGAARRSRAAQQEILVKRSFMRGKQDREPMVKRNPKGTEEDEKPFVQLALQMMDILIGSRCDKAAGQFARHSRLMAERVLRHVRPLDSLVEAW
eukprot:Skav219735  [mRNA]  locus=scaffold301:407980:426786:- [translate_table: standard]